MEPETEKPEMQNNPYARPFRKIRSFDEWLALWNAAENVEVAVGLLDANRFWWQNHKPVGERFVLELARHIKNTWSCRCGSIDCEHYQLFNKVHDLVLHFIREPQETKFEYGNRKPDWLASVERDPELFPLALEVLNHHHYARDKAVEAFVMRCFDIYNHQDGKDWRQKFAKQIRANLEPLLEMSHAEHVRAGDRSDEMIAALRRLAFKPDDNKRVPRDLDEALCAYWPNAFFARKLLTMEATRRGQERLERERLEKLEDRLTKMRAQPELHTFAEIHDTAEEMKQLRRKLGPPLIHD